jgi:hypothetical protein
MKMLDTPADGTVCQVPDSPSLCCRNPYRRNFMQITPEHPLEP